MAKINKEQIRRTVNSCSIDLLEWIGYEVSEDFCDQNIRNHCGLVLTSLGMFALSMASLLNGVGWLVFVLHSINIFYKLLILRIQKRIAVMEAEQEKQGMAPQSARWRVVSPFHRQYNLLVFMLVMLFVAMVVTILYKGDSAWFFLMVAITNLLASGAKEVIDGLVALYCAKGAGHCILKKRNW